MLNFVDIYKHIFDQRPQATIRAGAKNPIRSNRASNSKASVSTRRTAVRPDDHPHRRGGDRWFLVRTLVGKELQARMQLQTQGFRTFLPQYLQTTAKADQLRTVRISLFPSYVFVMLNLHRDRWRSIRSMAGVASIFSTHTLPTAAPPGLVEALMACADEEVGPFADFLTMLDHTDEVGRVRLLLEIMGSENGMPLPRAGFSPAA